MNDHCDSQVTFSQDEDHDFYHRCFMQVQFHTKMVLYPLVVMLVCTVLFTVRTNTNPIQTRATIRLCLQ